MERKVYCGTGRNCVMIFSKMYLGSLLRNVQKEEWQHFRKIVNKVMLKPQVTKQYLAGINKVAEDFIERIKDIRNDKNEMPDDFANELNKWGLESVSFVAVNTRLGCLGKNLAEDSEPQKIIRAIQESLRLMYFLNGVPNFSAYYPTRRWREYVKHLDTIFETIHKILINTTEEVERNPKGENEEKSIFERLIEIDKKVALVMALDMIQAGVDTTSALVSKVLYMLAVNPEKQERLRQELAEFAPDGKITAANQDKLVYLRACIRETNRIIPVAPGNQRIIEKDTVLGGYQIPKGTSAVLCHMTMSNMEKYFDNPEEFRPERWLRSDPNWNGNISKFISLPFGHGARSCIGRRIAEMEIETLISQLVTNFDIYWHHEPLQFKTTLLHIPASPLKYKFVDRQK
ncbi:probable cytochrome P450 301a1, mitochondrial isoform X2 [Prorops nasuta]|uniref:probable cytochrome P450 301a1, mitochondrial isoform X2 n=1 Tax=Prorops nasuta TaxID=863751 RepID=UPI0034CD0E5D